MENRKNKLKILSYALALSLSTTSLTGCGGLSYNTNAEGEFVVEGKITYDSLMHYKLVELKLLNNEHKLFIVSKSMGWDSIAFEDIFTGKTIYHSASDSVSESVGDIEQLELVNEYDFDDYLVTYDEVKDSYSIEDIQRIYDKILEDYEFGKEKTLEK